MDAGAREKGLAWRFVGQKYPQQNQSNPKPIQGANWQI